MAKNFFSKFGFILVLLVVAGLWLASIVEPDLFGAFNMQWALVILSGGIGIFYLLRAMGKNLVQFKKFYVLVGTSLVIIAIVLLINIYAFDDKIILPVIAIVACLGLLFSLVVTGGKKWDQADNKVIGYQDYASRKAEAERKEAKEERQEERAAERAAKKGEKNK